MVHILMVTGTIEHYTQGTRQLLMTLVSEPHGKRDLMRKDGRETSLSAGELQRKNLKQPLHVMISRQDRRKVPS
jgi:hypothetical protein